MHTYLAFLDPLSIFTGVSLLYNLYQSVRHKDAEQAIDGLTSAIEATAANPAINPKVAVAAKLASPVIELVNRSLDRQGLRKRRSRERAR